MTRYSVQPRDIIFVKCYGFLSCKNTHFVWLDALTMLVNNTVNSLLIKLNILYISFNH